MKNSGTYEESLPCGGKLKVTISDWEVMYYFSGPDFRHKGTFVHLPGSKLSSYIAAYTENWCEFEKLKSDLPPGGDFNKPGKGEMTIRVGRFAEGICIRSYHNPVSSRAALEKVIMGYRYAIERAPKVQSMLKSLSSDA